MSARPSVDSDRWGISVCMATFDGAEFLADQLDSILAQLDPADELVIVDDASTDNSVELIEDIAASAGCPIHVLQNSENLGHVASFERALHRASRPIIMLADQDDVWLPGYVEDVRRLFAADQTVGLAVARPVFSTADLTPIESSNERYRHPRHGGLLGVLLFLLNRAMPIGCTMSLRRLDLDYALPFPPGTLAHDHWLFAVVTAHKRMRPIETPALHYRRHSGVVTHKRSPLPMLHSRLRLIMQLLRHGLDRRSR